MVSGVRWSGHEPTTGAGATVTRRLAAVRRLMIALAFPLVLTVTSAVSAVAQRTVTGTTVTSQAAPPATITLDSTLTYVGEQQLVMNLVADAEQYLFVESERDRIRRLYWVQFEGYRDTWRTYDYSADSAVVVDGRRLYVSFRFYGPAGFAGPAGSDGDRAQQFLERHGYVLPEHLGRVRLVWLWDEAARNELMIIYVEDLAARGMTVGDLRENPERWRALQGDLLDRALAGVTIRPLSPP